MDFKNKAGTVDGHNVNLNFKPDNADRHNIVLNFEHKADGSTNLNFGDDNSGNLRAAINTGFKSKITAVYVDSDVTEGSLRASINTAFTARITAQYQFDQLKAVINTGFKSQITGGYGDVGYLKAKINTGFIAHIVAQDASTVIGSLKASVNTGFNLKAAATFDINHQPGISYFNCLNYQTAKPALLDHLDKWAKPQIRAQLSAFIFEQAQPRSNQVNASFSKTKPLNQMIVTVWQQATDLQSSVLTNWQDALRLRLVEHSVWQAADHLQHMRKTTWDEMVRKRRRVTCAYDVAHVFERRLSFEYDNGLELIVADAIPWDKAKPTYYRKQTIKPWPKPEIIQGFKSTNLNFCCESANSNRFDVALNFKEDRCNQVMLPQPKSRKWWHIVNEINVTRIDNDQPLTVMNGSFNTDRSRWCWNYNLTIPASELSKTAPIDGQPVILKIEVNGNVHLMLLENRTRSRQFAKDTYTLTGRSPSALLAPPYAPTRSFTQENERTASQLAQAELDRVNSDITLNWQLIDSLGWILPANSLTYGNSSPIGAINMLAEAGGGFVYSEPDSKTLTIKPLYKKTFWDALDVGDYDRLIDDSIVTDLSTDYEPYPNYNGVWLTNDRSGLSGRVVRTGTAGDVLQEPVNSWLLTDAAVMHSKGRAILAKAGLVERHTLQMPIHADIGLCVPGELAAFNGEWWGIVDSVSVSFSFGKAVQTVVIERVNHE